MSSKLAELRALKLALLREFATTDARDMLAIRGNRRLAISAGVLAALLSLPLFWFMLGERSYFGDSTLWATRQENLSDFYVRSRGGPDFLKPLWKLYYRLRPPPPLPGSIFNASSPHVLCSISGLLQQCHDASGTQFFVDKNVACGSVEFGSTNSLPGPQWVSAFTNALQTGSPEWFEPKTQSFQKENLVSIPVGRAAFLVLPKERVKDFQNHW